MVELFILTLELFETHGADEVEIEALPFYIKFFEEGRGVQLQISSQVAATLHQVFEEGRGVYLQISSPAALGGRGDEKDPGANLAGRSPGHLFSLKQRSRE